MVVPRVNNSLVVLYIKDHGGLSFLAKNITEKSASQYHPGTLAALDNLPSV